MKKLIFIMLVSLFTLPVVAQVQRKVVKDSTAMAEKKDKVSKKQQYAELDLTKEQKGKMKEMRKSNKAAKDAIMNDESLNDEQKKMKVEALKKENARKMQGTFTPEQKKKLMQMRKNKKNEEM